MKFVLTYEQTVHVEDAVSDTFEIRVRHPGDDPLGSKIYTIPYWRNFGSDSYCQGVSWV